MKVLTNFVKGSPIAHLIKDGLRARRMDYEGPEVDQGGPWGYRHQFNLADSGFGTRGPRVHNDRAGEVGRILNVRDFDLERIFGEEARADRPHVGFDRGAVPLRPASSASISRVLPRLTGQ